MRLTPQQVIANVLGNFEDEGFKEPEAMGWADDILHGLHVAGYMIVDG